MKPFFTTVIGGMAIVFLVITHVDPKHLFHRELLPATPPLSGEVMPGAIFFKYGPRPLKLAHLNYIQPPDLVALGASRIFLMNAHMFSDSVRFFNLSVEAAGTMDFIGLWEALNADHKRPAFLLIVPDGYSINQKTYPSLWASILKYVNQFVFRTEIPPQTSGQAIHRLTIHVSAYALEGWYIATETMSWEMFRDSLKSLWHRRPVWDMRGVVKEENAPRDGPLYFGDGSINEFPISAQGGSAQARLYGSLPQGLAMTQLYPWTLNNNAMRLLDTLLKDAHQKGTHVMFVIPPFHPQSFKNIKDSPLLSEALKQYQSAFKTLAQNNPETAYCDVMDPAVLRCTENDFADALHILPACEKRLIQYCFSKQRNWDALLKK